MKGNRINIFTGHFGSGKTEVAVNFVLNLASLNKMGGERCEQALIQFPNVILVDLDIVNPFFRSSDVKDKLQDENIQVISPTFVNTNVDVSVVTGQVNSAFDRKDASVVIDVGGDDIGAKALSRYRDDILKDSYDMLMVVNVKRPLTDTAEKIENMVRDIEMMSRLKITKIVNNTNLLDGTTLDDVLKGHALIREVSDKLGIPIAFVSGMRQHIGGIEDIIADEVFYLDKIMKSPW